ncbi:MAG: TlpA family protein disulfide reductase [Treponema sp.]|jgi:thiol-disulfide isomerase/thioredoxin|nr:TlpA family protein disulfide reductase [Treponema sp.]
MKKIVCVMVVIMSFSLVLHADPMDLSVKVQDGFKKAGLPLLRQKRAVKDFTLKTVDGKDLNLGQLKGKVVFLNFWATWCPPCRLEMPSMEILYQRFKGKGLEFVAVDIMENNRQVSDFVRDNAYTFPVALDANGEISGNFGIQAVPATFIIDRDGKIILATVGARDWNTPAILAAFEGLLANGQ